MTSRKERLIGQPVRIHWFDSQRNEGAWEPRSKWLDFDLAECETVGIVTHIDDTRIVLHQTQGCEEDPGLLAIFSIPLSVITRCEVMLPGYVVKL